MDEHAGMTRHETIEGLTYRVPNVWMQHVPQAHERESEPDDDMDQTHIVKPSSGFNLDDDDEEENLTGLPGCVAMMQAAGSSVVPTADAAEAQQKQIDDCCCGQVQ